MRKILTLSLVLMTVKAFAVDPSCASEAAELAFQAYANRYGDPAGTSLRMFEAKDGSTYFRIVEGKNNHEHGPVTYTVTFDNPPSDGICPIDTYQIYESKK